MILIEGLVACFLLLIPCVVGIANGPVSLVCLYEKEVQDRVVEKGLITRERINRNANYFRLFGILPFYFRTGGCVRHQRRTRILGRFLADQRYSADGRTFRQAVH